MDIETQVSLAEHTWWKIGGPADHFCLPANVDDLRGALDRARDAGWPVTVLGGGTNVLVSDEGIAGLVIGMRNLRGLDSVERDGHLKLTAWAGTPKAEVTREFLKRRLAPARFLCGLPGDVGGGVVMNAGVGENVRPRDFHEIVEWIEVLRGDEVARLARADVEWAYRRTDGWRPGVVTRIGLSWPLESDPDVPTAVKLATRERLRRQPLDLPSGGSTFKNPLPRTAGQLIEAAGLKGYRVGDAQVSPKHANFIVNLGRATARDVRAVIDHVRTTVRDHAGVELETEVKILGR